MKATETKRQTTDATEQARAELKQVGEQVKLLLTETEQIESDIEALEKQLETAEQEAAKVPLSDISDEGLQKYKQTHDRPTLIRAALFDRRKSLDAKLQAVRRSIQDARDWWLQVADPLYHQVLDEATSAVERFCHSRDEAKNHALTFAKVLTAWHERDALPIWGVVHHDPAESGRRLLARLEKMGIISV